MDSSQKKILDANKKFGELLQIKRSAENEKKVEEIIATYKDLFKRIELIEELDRQQQARKLSSEDIRKSSSRSPVGSARTDSGSKVTKSNYQPKGFWGFLFGTRKDLIDLSEKKNILRSRLFGTQFELHPDVIRYIKTFPVNDIAVLHKKIKSFLVDAWKYLSVFDYNVLVYYNNMLSGLFHFLSVIEQGNREAEDLLKIGNKFIPYFLGVDQEKKYMDRLFQIQRFMLRNEELKKHEMLILDLNGKLFDEENNSIDVKEIIIGLVAIRDRNVPREADLDVMFGVQKINEKKYNVSPDIAVKIEQYYKTIDSEIDSIRSDLKKIKIIKNDLLSLTEDGKYVFPVLKNILIYVFEKSGVFDQKLKAEVKKVILNPILLQREILAYFVNEAKPILQSQIPIGQENNLVSIFHNSLFTEYVSSFEELLGEVEKLLIKFPTFTMNFTDFYKLRERKGVPANIEKQDQDAGEVQEKNFKILLRSSRNFYKLGQKLLIVLSNHGEAERLNIQEKSNLKQKSDNPISNFEEKARLLPFYTEKIVGKGAYAGLSSFGAVLEITKICFNFALLCKEPEMLETIRSEKKLSAKIQSLEQKKVSED